MIPTECTETLHKGDKLKIKEQKWIGDFGWYMIPTEWTEIIQKGDKLKIKEQKWIGDFEWYMNSNLMGWKRPVRDQTEKLPKGANSNWMDWKLSTKETN